MGGDDHTVAAAVVPLNNPYGIGGWASSYRQIVDLGELANSLSMHTTGQSGHVMSEDYDNMLNAWSRFHYHPMSLPFGDVRRELNGHLVLEPAPKPAAVNPAAGDGAPEVRAFHQPTTVQRPNVPSQSWHGSHRQHHGPFGRRRAVQRLPQPRRRPTPGRGRGCASGWP